MDSFEERDKKLRRPEDVDVVLRLEDVSLDAVVAEREVEGRGGDDEELESLPKTFLPHIVIRLVLFFVFFSATSSGSSSLCLPGPGETDRGGRGSSSVVDKFIIELRRTMIGGGVCKLRLRNCSKLSRPSTVLGSELDRREEFVLSLDTEGVGPIATVLLLMANPTESVGSITAGTGGGGGGAAC